MGTSFATAVGANASSVAPAASATAPPRCKDVVLITAVGSGEKMSTSLGPGETTKMSLLEAAFAEAMKGEDAPTYVIESLPYTAAPVDLIWKELGGVIPYLDSVQNGVTTLRDRMKALSENCPAQRYTLAGYSQGAIVVHQYVSELARDPATAALFNRIDGLALVADGSRVSKTKAKQLGDAPKKATGIAEFAKQTGMWRYAAPVEIDSPLLERTVDICDKQDVVCDTNDVFANCWKPVLGFLGCIPALKLGAEVHTTHYDEKVKKAAADLARFARQFPRPASDHMTFAGVVGQPLVDASLAVRAIDAQKLRWRVKNGASLPAGITLDQGQLRGTPSAAGVTDVVVRVARDGYPAVEIAVTLAVTTPGIPGTLPDATQGEPYSAQLQAGLSGSLTWRSSLPASLPRGLALSPAGVLSGTPQEPGDFAIGVTVTNDAGEFLTGAVVLRVAGAHQLQGPFLRAWPHAVGEPVPVPPSLPDKPVAQIAQATEVAHDGQFIVLYSDGAVERRQWTGRDWFGYPIDVAPSGSQKITRVSAGAAYITDGSAVYNLLGRQIYSWQIESRPQFVDIVGDSNVGVILDNQGHVHVDSVAYNPYGPGAAPDAVNGHAVSIAYTTWTAAAVTTDGAVTVWGRQADRLAPPPGLCPATKVSLTGTGAAVVCTDGSVQVWGLPDGDSRLTPPPSLTDAVDVVLGNGVGLALKKDGTVVAWGDQRAVVPTGLNHVTTISSGFVEAVGRG